MPGPYPQTMRLTVIGGSGGHPGRGRPCGGYIVQVEGFGLLIDPGYGVATALSMAGAPSFDAVLVSHAHPDHCADLNPILRGRQFADDPLPPLPVHALPGALDAVLALDRPEVLEGTYKLRKLEPGKARRVGPFDVASALLPHPRPNLGFRISVAGSSLVYTGDCGPSETLVTLAEDADVLLAEATFARIVPPENVGALSSAADVGREAAAARVGRLVLTHLMPATDEVDSMAAAAQAFSGRIEVAVPGLVIEL